MSTLNRLLHMVLRGNNVQFKNILQEVLQERVAILMEQMYKIEAQKYLLHSDKSQIIQESVDCQELNIKASTLVLNDGNTVILSENEISDMLKLYKNLNNDNKERMVKLLSESKESVNRILNITKVTNRG